MQMQLYHSILVSNHRIPQSVSKIAATNFQQFQYLHAILGPLKAISWPWRVTKHVPSIGLEESRTREEGNTTKKSCTLWLRQMNHKAPFHKF